MPLVWRNINLTTLNLNPNGECFMRTINTCSVFRSVHVARNEAFLECSGKCHSIIENSTMLWNIPQCFQYSGIILRKEQQCSGKFCNCFLCNIPLCKFVQFYGTVPKFLGKSIACALQIFHNVCFSLEIPQCLCMLKWKFHIYIYIVDHIIQFHLTA